MASLGASCLFCGSWCHPTAYCPKRAERIARIFGVPVGVDPAMPDNWVNLTSADGGQTWLILDDPVSAEPPEPARREMVRTWLHEALASGLLLPKTNPKTER